MEVDPNLSLLHRNLKVDDPWIPPRSWESIRSESGCAGAASSDPRRSQSPIHDTPIVSESALVRLVTNALLGVKSALVQVDRLAKSFSLSSADRTSHGNPNLWRRSSSSKSQGELLRSLGRSGLVFFLLRKFVDYNLFSFPDAARSLVNQAFVVAVGKVLEGCASALNTLSTSVKLRRGDVAGNVLDGAGNLMSVVHSNVTVLEVFLHTKELRGRIEALGNICFADFVDIFGEDVSVDTEIDFGRFPRGADLLTYLYVRLRDADQVHHALLRFLFLRSCEPFCGFIKSWIYRASVDDPYEEFHVVNSDGSPTSKTKPGSLNDLSVAYAKELEFVLVPCFLKDVYRPLIRSGQQLQVLVKLLNLCNCRFLENHRYEGTKDLGYSANLGDVLPYWEGASSDSALLLSPLTFCRKQLQALSRKRETVYKMMLDKLHHFFRKLDIKYLQLNNTVISSATMPVSHFKKTSIDVSLAFDWDVIWSSTFYEQKSSEATPTGMDIDASSTSDDFFNEVDPRYSSESSSLNGYEEDSASVEISIQSNVTPQPENSMFSSIFRCYKSILHRPSSLQTSPSNTCEGVCQISPVVNKHDNDMKLNEVLIPHPFEDSKRARTAGFLDEDFQPGRCWPLGGLLVNPFCSNTKPTGPQERHVDDNSEVIESDKSYFGDGPISGKSGLDPIWQINLMNETSGAQSSSCTHESWSSCDSFDFCINPMLRKAGWLHGIQNLRQGSSLTKMGSFLSYFDFSAVSDPCKAYEECLPSATDHKSLVEAPINVGSSVPAIETVNAIVDTCTNCLTDEPTLNTSLSAEENLSTVKYPQSASGGADWAGSLSYSGENFIFFGGDMEHGQSDVFETPLDVVIDKCIVQEILLQYNYLSNFTIQLLEEGFGLHGHLLALRRYHFMGLADWADSFVLSICNQKWYGIHKIAEIQGLLELAMQRSSCERDQYRERLFIYLKVSDMMSPSTSASGIHAFNFIALGYKVDWPVSIIITREALAIYAEIFSYLIQIRRAAFSLTEVWLSLKAIMHSTNQTRYMKADEVKDANILIKMRQQVSHFITTLQQYVHSQLSDVSWCQFQHSLKHKVKDMFDLDTVHMSYLDDALRICFLSNEMQPIANIIKNILQCALDFRLCIIGSSLSVGSDVDSSGLLSHISFAQVFAVKATFEKNIKDLYLLYLKSPKHSEFGVCRFWDYLNYNDYYATTVSRGTGFMYL